MIQSSIRLPLIFLCLTGAWSFCTPATAAFFEESKLVILRGQVVCLDKSGRPVDALFQCNDGRYGFVDKTAKLYIFSESDALAKVFDDTRVRLRKLQITARFTSSERLELIKVQSLREEKLHDLYYFCDVCNITSYVPGLCPCCRAEMEFVEKPA